MFLRIVVPVLNKLSTRESTRFAQVAAMKTCVVSFFERFLVEVVVLQKRLSTGKVEFALVRKRISGGVDS